MTAAGSGWDGTASGDPIADIRRTIDAAPSFHVAPLVLGPWSHLDLVTAIACRDSSPAPYRVKCTLRELLRAARRVAPPAFPSLVARACRAEPNASAIAAAILEFVHPTTPTCARILPGGP